MSKVLMDESPVFRIQLEQEMVSNQWRLMILFTCPNSGKAEGFTLRQDDWHKLADKLKEAQQEGL